MWIGILDLLVKGVIDRVDCVLSACLLCTLMFEHCSEMDRIDLIYAKDGDSL